MERNASGGAVLDYYHDVGAGRVINIEVEIMVKLIMNRMLEALGEANKHYVLVMTTPNAIQRFWIITMMLVLVGLSTLKLR
jgi:UDP-N-acetylmuramyl pentapeptide phosphotransferase/UDP-N-acetylglucosamine-1-phosphate transferase